MPPSTTRRLLLAGLALGTVAISTRSTAQEGVPLARTRYGQVSGLFRNEISVFLGVPYGASTGGQRRFLPPVPPAPWTGTRDASKLGPRAPQGPGAIYTMASIGPFMTGGHDKELVAAHEPEGEDCLVLNVLTPRVDDKRRPVLVYFHGGGYTSGSGAVMSLSDRLVFEQDVVLVTVNHRLGALGFMYLGGLSPQYVDGNVGLLDLVASLEWVRDNISAFGGDPTKVTIFGESGGAGKVAMVAAMPRAKGLFRAAIMQSGLLPTTQSTAEADATARKVLDDLGVTPANLSALQSVPVSSLVAVGDRAANPVGEGRTLAPDPWAKAPDTVSNVPMIIGYCAHELSLFSSMTDPATFNLDWSTLPRTLERYLELSPAQVTSIILAYHEAEPQEDAVGLFFRIISDGNFGRGMIQVAELKAAQPAPVYFYRVEYDTQIDPGLRAFHTTELPLIGRLVLQPRSESLSRVLSGAWAALAHSGASPDGPGLPRWPEHKPGDDMIMTFDVKSSFERNRQAPAFRSLIAALGDRMLPIARQPAA